MNRINHSGPVGQPVDTFTKTGRARIYDVVHAVLDKWVETAESIVHQIVDANQQEKAWEQAIASSQMA